MSTLQVTALGNEFYCQILQSINSIRRWYLAIDSLKVEKKSRNQPKIDIFRFNSKMALESAPKDISAKNCSYRTVVTSQKTYTMINVA